MVQEGKKKRHIPERTCIGCGKKQSKYAMWRFVFRSPDRLVHDVKYREPGRGAYICPDPACFHSVVKRRALNRAFRRPIPQSCYSDLLHAMETKLEPR